MLSIWRDSAGVICVFSPSLVTDGSISPLPVSLCSSDEVLTVHQPAVHSPTSPYIHYLHIYIRRSWENQSLASKRH